MNPGTENFEEALRKALQRESAPPDFAAKVMSKTRTRVAKRKSWLQRPFSLALAAALAAVAIVPAVVLDYQRREDAKGLKAKRDLLTALAITRDQLQQARAKVQRSTRNIQ